MSIDFRDTTPLDIVEEIVSKFDQAREAGGTEFRSIVGSRFEARCRAVLAAAQAARPSKATRDGE